jgi:hypothetical protein
MGEVIWMRHEKVVAPELVGPASVEPLPQPGEMRSKAETRSKPEE